MSKPCQVILYINIYIIKNSSSHGLQDQEEKETSTENHGAANYGHARNNF